MRPILGIRPPRLILALAFIAAIAFVIAGCRPPAAREPSSSAIRQSSNSRSYASEAFARAALRWRGSAVHHENPKADFEMSW